MRAAAWILPLSVMTFALFAARPARADISEDAKEALVIGEVRAESPAAADALERARAARELQRFAEADRWLESVRGATHVGGHVERRLCMTKLALQQRDAAVPLCREALGYRDSPENQGALAFALGFGQPNAVDAREALEHARRAARAQPDQSAWQMAMYQAGLALQDLHVMDASSQRLVALAPKDPSAHDARGFYLAGKGELGAAQREFDRAHELGLSDADYARLTKMVDEARPLSDKVLPKALLVLAVWLGGMALLLGLAWLLGGATLREATRLASRADGGAGASTGGARVLRRVYGAVLTASCVYYYASIPLVVLATLGGAAGVVYACFEMGRIPVKLVAIVGIVALVSVWAVLKSLFVRVRDEEPGEKLDFAAHPAVRATLDEVARAIGTRPVDTAYLTPGTQVAVFERGGLFAQMRGASERCLLLGVGVLDGMTVRELKSILAHEYGHFRNEDTARGGFALAVRRSLLAFAHGLARHGAATWYNPSWLFVNGFHRVFLRVSQGASRLQEILADRWAAHAYGSDAFARGLRHVVARSIAFDVHATASLREVIKEKRALSNLYSYAPTKSAPPADLEDAVRDALERPASPYDSHPPPAQRIAWVTLLDVKLDESASDAEGAWSLFADRGAIEEQMTGEICAQIMAEHGVAIARGEAPAAA